MASTTRTVLVTGAARGIGRATAELFAAHGWRVFAAVRDMRGVRFTSPEISIIQMDVDSLASIQRAFHLSGARFDAVINNAATGLHGPFEGYADKDIEALLRTNVLGVARVIRTAVPYMRAGGTIINISSVLGHIGAPYYSMYSASKFALVGLSEALAVELAVKKLRVKLVEPGAVKSGFFRKVDGENKEYAALGKRVERWYAKNFGTGDDPAAIAKLVLAAATDGTATLYYRPRKTKMPLLLKRLLPTGRFARFIRGALR